MGKLPCPEELWPAFSALLDDALQQPEDKRAAWLATRGPEYADAVQWVAKVIGGAGAADDPAFLSSPGWRDAVPDSDFLPEQRVGAYVLERRLGGGGMGEVWLAARRDGTLNRQVALKLPYAHLLAGTTRRRFERERDILAALSHPHIAVLYDAGVDDDGTPFLAMEWVDGQTLLEHCRRNASSLAGRLDLVLQILDAIAYAHGRLVAHRDIKPSNILVTSDGRVKLLDFGIAKLVTGDTEAEGTQLTQLGSRLATPDYAAPEQLAGQPITVAVDIYALGVVLHEILTGQRPVGESMRASSCLVSGHARHVGGMSAKQLRRALAGDLDAIVAKALEAKPADRYATADAFAQDIRLSREHRPIAARRISAVTLAAKYARRHWLGLSMAAGLLLVIIAGSIGIAWQGVRATREAQRATAIKDFLIGVFRASDPRIARDKPRGEITARELLDISSDAIDREFAHQRATQIELLGVTAEIYRELDETKRSTLLYERETALASGLYGPADPRSIEGLLGQAYNAVVGGDSTRSLELLRQAEPLISNAGLDRSVTRARWHMIRGEALAATDDGTDTARAALSAAVALFAEVAPHDTFYPDALIDLGALALERSQFPASAAYYRQAIDVASAGGVSSGTLLPANAGLALALLDQGDFAGAALAFESATDIAARTHGRDNQSYWSVASDWARFRYERGERRAALDAFETLVAGLPSDASRFRNAYETIEAAQVLRKFGRCLAIDGQGDRAVETLQRAQALLATTTTAHQGDEALMTLDFGRALEAQGRLQAARDAFGTAVAAYEHDRASNSQLAVAHERLGRSLLLQNEPQAAENEFRRALELAAGHVIEPAIYARVGLGAVALQKRDKDAAGIATNETLHAIEHIEGPYDVRVAPYVWQIRAQYLLSTGDAAGARVLAQRAKDAVERYYSPQSVAAAQSEALLRETVR